MKHFKPLMKSFLGVMAVLAMVSCQSDTWKDHYSFRSEGSDPVGSLAQTIKDIPEAAKFVKALETTYMYNGDKQLRITYWDFLNDNQFLTVWLPDASSISDAEWDIYTSTDDNKDHKAVGTEFILNHIARFSHPVGSDTKEKVKMMSDKTYRSVSDAIGGVGYKEKNIRCSNGVLHQLSGKIVYRPSLYEYITGRLQRNSDLGNSYDYKTILGDWIDLYTKEELDESRSVQGEVNDKGEIEYIDKVIIRENPLLKKFAFIDSEDSTYIVVLPEPTVWVSAYDSVSHFYSYEDDVIGKDSLQKYWTNYTMLTDLFFNKNTQKSVQDSATSTQFKWSERMTEKYPYHVFYKPYDDGGLFAAAQAGANGVIDSVTCSNGIIYVRNDWPYSDSIFRRTIKLEAEDVLFENVTTRPKSARYPIDSVTSKSARVMEIYASTINWDVKYEVKNTLAGKYLFKLVFFRNGDKKSNTVYANIDYLHDGSYLSLYASKKGPKTTTFTVGTSEKPDTLTFGPFELPTGNYEAGFGRLRVNVGVQKGESNKIWFDGIILEPVFE